ncbi:MAG: bifunctional glycosyltransferase family 2/GtrA family protein [Clostridia bacterium]|nr:bifunctional glycosyltransferase family 2/GtrA family protein [Clostridia bacterium]
MAITVLIPSLNPDEKLVRVVEDLLAAGVEDVLLVDDGSDEAHQIPFATLSALPQVTLLRHEVNRGKGRALKTGFAHVLEHRPDCAGVVTVDGDGQHGTRDVCRLAEALEQEPTVWLGCRDFNHPDVPPRSRFGNKASCLTMRLLCRVNVSDTQTGLRGIPRSLLPAMLEIEGERFEYETNMLLAFPQLSVVHKELTIETIYIDDNATSHFRPIRDGWRIYRLMLGYFLRFTASGLISAVVDVLLFTLFLSLFTTLGNPSPIVWATVVARVISSLLNFALNYRVVFRSQRQLGSSLWRYYLLCLCQMFVSAELVALLSTLLPLWPTLIKCVVDVVLFLISFRIQQRFVFHKK